MLLLSLLFLSPPAEAGRCQPLYEIEMREIVDARDHALLDSELPDVAEHDRLSRVLELRLPCADFLIPAQLWRQYLVGNAVRDFFRDGAWEPSLTTALRIPSDTPLPVRQGHPLQSFVPAARPEPTGTVRSDVELYLDGERISVVVPLDAVHLLQKVEGDGYLTDVITGPANIPNEFLAKPRPPQAVRDARRKRAAHLIGSATSGVLLVGGGVSWGLGQASYTKFRNPQTDPSELDGLRSRGKPLTKGGIAMSSVGAVGMVTTWVIPW